MKAMRHITQEGLDLIKDFEGLYLESYICPGGYPTIGYGHVIRKGRESPKKITKEVAESLLRKDVEWAEFAVLRLIDVPLTDGQFDGLVSFTFNLGSGALQRSTLRRKVNREEHREVPAELLRWVWAGGKKLKGLIRRRIQEGKRYSWIEKASPTYLSYQEKLFFRNLREQKGQPEKRDDFSRQASDSLILT